MLVESCRVVAGRPPGFGEAPAAASMLPHGSVLARLRRAILGFKASAGSRRGPSWRGRVTRDGRRARSSALAGAGPSHARATMTTVTASTPTTLTLVIGEEELLSARAITEVITAARQRDSDCDVTEVVAPGLTPAALYDLVSPTLFGGGRVVVIRDTQRASKDLAASLTGYANDPAEDVHLVVAHAGGRGTALPDALRAAGARVVECRKLTRSDERIRFIRSEVDQAGGTITPRAAAVLLDAVGNDLRDLAGAAAQLVADAGGELTETEVGRYYRGRAEVNGFTVSDRAVVGDGNGALEALRWALSIGVPHVLIADALADGVRTIAKVTGAGHGNQNAVAGSLGMPPWKVRNARARARGWTEAGLREALGVVARANAAVKGAAADPSYALEIAVREVVAARRG